MIGVSEEVRKDIQLDMFSSLIYADTKLIDNKHSGKFITNLGNDVGLIINLVATGVLNLFKDSLNINWIIDSNVLSKLEIIFISNSYDTSS